MNHNTEHLFMSTILNLIDRIMLHLNILIVHYKSNHINKIFKINNQIYKH